MYSIGTNVSLFVHQISAYVRRRSGSVRHRRDRSKGVYMSFIDKFVDNLKSRQHEEDDEYFLDDDYYDEGEYYEEEEPAPKKPGLFSRKEPANGEQRSVGGGLFGRKVVSIDGGSGMQVTMKKPSTLDDSRDICDDLLAGKAVVINLEGISTDTAQRIIDFTLGAVYSIDGDLQMISKYIFIASPHTVELSGDFAGDFAKMSSSQPESRARSGAFAFNG